ncbi:hypothetical protein BKA62DRAFT_488698 [Auriculariales sp. MPI-PUGE-AT-0066]|nr:hypothetical protein BKA62DRAFT_488698 [Auriculariales sp. MPI-PUGE-AT-0066]
MIIKISLRLRIQHLSDQPLLQMSYAYRYGWDTLKRDALARCAGMKLDMTIFPNDMTGTALIELFQQRHSRIALFNENIQQVDRCLGYEVRGKCTTCTADTQAETQMLWTKFQLCATLAFAEAPSIEGVFANTAVQGAMDQMMGHRAQCGHNPWHQLHSKIHRLLDPRPTVRRRFKNFYLHPCDPGALYFQPQTFVQKLHSF